MSLLQFINHQLNTDIAANIELPFSVSEKVFEKGVIISHYGHIESNVYFTNNGIVEFTIAHEVQEKIIEFFMTGDSPLQLLRPFCY